ncbi:hypothetical protein B296_00006014 [Ensete ventricosum]|uniref:Uncharacterized protein n=1 Tax=Ensete ventricosum TaxID=4639 RepID=A0A426Z441_ENSVE|nr:hypothetical protein B296_00006014 [Ensete ventricosum]
MPGHGGCLPATAFACRRAVSPRRDYCFTQCHCLDVAFVFMRLMVGRPTQHSSWVVTGVVITMRGQSRCMAHRLAVSMIDAAIAVRTLSSTIACHNRCDHRCCTVIKDRDKKTNLISPTSRRQDELNRNLDQ